MSQLEEAREVIASLLETLEEDGQGALDVCTEARWFLDATQDKVYAVQFRSMRTAIHNVIIFEEQHSANFLHRLFAINEQFPDDLEEYTSAPCLDMYEIDYRNPPKEYKGKKLVIINNVIPDVYGV